MADTEISLVDPEVSLVEQEFMEVEADPSFDKLPAKLQRFCHLYLSGAYRQTQIAQLLHVSIHTVRNWLRNPRVRSAINQYQAEEHELVLHRIKALNMKAIDKLDELLDSDIDGIKYQAVRDVLDRTGHKATVKQEVDINIRTYEQTIKELVKSIDNPSEFIDAEFKIEE